MEGNFNRHLGAKLRLRRLALGLTQDHFEKLAIAKDWISIETCIKANKNFII